MKRPFTRLEKKQLLIFALIAFGIPYLMGIPMAFGYQRGTSLDFFANAQMYYPAAGAIVVFLLTKTEFPMPRRFFYGYLVLTVLFAISSVLSVLIPDANLWVMVINMLTIAGNLALWVLFLLDKREVRFIWGLTWSGPDSRRHFLYVVLFFMLFTGNLLISSFTDNYLQDSLPRFFLLLRCSGLITAFFVCQLFPRLFRLFRRRIWMALLFATDPAGAFWNAKRSSHPWCILGIVASPAEPVLLCT